MVKKKIIKGLRLSPKIKKTKIDNSIMKKYCPFFKAKCKGLNCVFGDKKEERGSYWSPEGDKEVLICKLFEERTGKMRFDIETSIKGEDD